MRTLVSASRRRCQVTYFDTPSRKEVCGAQPSSLAARSPEISMRPPKSAARAGVCSIVVSPTSSDTAVAISRIDTS